MTWFRLSYQEHYNVAVEADSKEAALKRFNAEGMADEFSRNLAYVDCDAEVWQELDGPEQPGISFPLPPVDPNSEIVVTARELISVDDLGTIDPEYVRGVVEMVQCRNNRKITQLQAAEAIDPEVGRFMRRTYESS